MSYCTQKIIGHAHLRIETNRFFFSFQDLRFPQKSAVSRHKHLGCAKNLDQLGLYDASLDTCQSCKLSRWDLFLHKHVFLGTRMKIHNSTTNLLAVTEHINKYIVFRLFFFWHGQPPKRMKNIPQSGVQGFQVLKKMILPSLIFFCDIFSLQKKQRENVEKKHFRGSKSTKNAAEYLPYPHGKQKAKQPEVWQPWGLLGY